MIEIWRKCNDKFLCCFLLLLNFVTVINTEDVFSSAEGLGSLIATENHVLNSLDETIQEIRKLRDKYESYRSKFVHHENATEEYTLKYVANPLNSFALIKRLTIDLGELKRINNETFEKIYQKLFNHSDHNYATSQDLEGICQLVAQLRYGYKQNVSQFTSGIINGAKYGEPLNSDDVYHFSKVICQFDRNEDCLLWLEEALRKWNENAEVSKFKIMEEISTTYFFLNNPNASLSWDNKILKEDPDNVETLLRKAQTLLELRNGNITNQTEETGFQDKYRELFFSLCNDEKPLPLEIQARLRCYYKYGRHPFLRIAPLKLEQLYIMPEVILAHDMMSDAEIEELHSKAKKNLIQSKVGTSPDGAILSKTRVSSTAFFDTNNETVEARVLRRSLDLTDLDWSDRGMDLQITHYPPGGHYNPHFDMTTPPHPTFDVGNRIVTVLHYLFDLEEGGGTALPNLELYVKPKKNAAVYWRNLHSSGEPDLRTLHGGCPVLHGIKWVSNVWIHESDQENATPCGLEYFPMEFNKTAIGDYNRKHNLPVNFN